MCRRRAACRCCSGYSISSVKQASSMHDGTNVPEDVRLLVLLKLRSPLGVAAMALSLEVCHDDV